MKVTRSEAAVGIIKALGISRENVKSFYFPPASTKLFVDYQADARDYVLAVDFDAGVELVNDDKSNSVLHMNRDAITIFVDSAHNDGFARADAHRDIRIVFEQVTAPVVPDSGAHDCPSVCGCHCKE